VSEAGAAAAAAMRRADGTAAAAVGGPRFRSSCCRRLTISQPASIREGKDSRATPLVHVQYVSQQTVCCVLPLASPFSQLTRSVVHGTVRTRPPASSARPPSSRMVKMAQRVLAGQPRHPQYILFLGEGKGGRGKLGNGPKQVALARPGVLFNRRCDCWRLCMTRGALLWSDCLMPNRHNSGRGGRRRREAAATGGGGDERRWRQRRLVLSQQRRVGTPSLAARSSFSFAPLRSTSSPTEQAKQVAHGGSDRRGRTVLVRPSPAAAAGGSRLVLLFRQQPIGTVTATPARALGEPYLLVDAGVVGRQRVPRAAMLALPEHQPLFPTRPG